MIFWSWVIVVAVSVPGAGGGARSQLGVRTAPRPQHPLPKTNNDCQIKCKLLHVRDNGEVAASAVLVLDVLPFRSQHRHLPVDTQDLGHLRLELGIAPF